MARFSRLDGMLVVEVVEIAPTADVPEWTLDLFRKRYHPSLVWVEAHDGVTEGMVYDEGRFVGPSES